MERLYRALSGRTVLFASSIPLAAMAAILDVIPTPVAVALAIVPLMGACFGQLSRSRRELVQEEVMTNERTGLGLPLSKPLMDLHGGRLELKSDVGVGTRVTVTFPPECCTRQSVETATTLCEGAAAA